MQDPGLSLWNWDKGHSTSICPNFEVGSNFLADLSGCVKQVEKVRNSLNLDNINVKITLKPPYHYTYTNIASADTKKPMVNTKKN